MYERLLQVKEDQMKYVIKPTRNRLEDLPFDLVRGDTKQNLDEDGVIAVISEKIHKCLQVIDFDLGDEVHIEITMKDQG
jgi:hypothetical protein